MRSVSILLLVLIVFAPLVLQSQNPFDLKHRMGKDTSSLISDTLKVGESTVDTPILEKMVTIPDEIVGDTLGSEIPADTIEEEADPADAFFEEAEPDVDIDDPDGVEESGKIEVVREVPGDREERSNFLLLIFLIIFLLLALVIAVDRSVMDKVYRALINDNFLNFFLREQKGGTSLQLFFLYIVFVVNLGLFVFLLCEKMLDLSVEIKLWQTTAGVAIIYLGRFLFLRYLKLFVEAKKEIGQFHFTIFIFNIFLGLMIFPINAFAAFAPEMLSTAALYIGVFMIISVFLLRQLRGLFIGSKYLITNQFHFFIYLCTVEIAPLAIMGKFFISIS